MHIKIVGLHAPHADRLQALLGPAHQVQGLAHYPAEGLIEADVLISNALPAEAAARLRAALVQVPGAGCEQIALAALPSGTKVCNVHGHEVPIAEFTVHALLEHQLQLWKYPAELNAAAFQASYAARPLHDEAMGKHVALLGYGHIGREIALRAKALGMRVTAITRSGRSVPEVSQSIAVAQLNTLLPDVDALVVCCPLDDSTRGLIGAQQLQLMRKTALLINVARAEVVDEQALYEALSNHRIARAVLDVWYQYPKAGAAAVAPSHYPLWALPNVRATPHISAITPGLLERRYAFMARNIQHLQHAEPLENLVYEQV